MELDEILNGLYSQNKNEILSIINIAHHAFDESYPENARFLHTGFYCKTHNEKIIEFIFCVDNKELYFQGDNKMRLCPLGLCMIPSGCVDYNNRIKVQYPHDFCSQDHCIYCSTYDIDKNKIYKIVTESIIEDNNSHYKIKYQKSNFDQFFMIKNGSIISRILHTPTMHTFYDSGNNKFRLK